MKLALGTSLSSNKGGTSSIVALANAFKARVIADSGTFEAKTCLTTQLRAINQIA